MGEQNIRWVEGLHWYLGHQWLWGACVSAACVQIAKLDQPAERRSISGEEDQVPKVPARQKSLADSQGNNKCARVCELGEWSVCACTSDLLSPRTGEGSALSVTPLWPAMLVSCICICVCLCVRLYVCLFLCLSVCLWNKWEAFLLVVPASRKATTVPLSLDRDSWSSN